MVEGIAETRGQAAERHVYDALRAALPAEYRLYPNVRWCARTRRGGPAHDGEADLVVVHPEQGLLVIEVKAGEPRRDATGRWWIGPNALDRSPFEQAGTAKHDLSRALIDLPDWPAHSEPRAGHAVAFPDVDLASLQRAHVLLAPDAPREILLDADALATPKAARAAVERAYAYWVGDGSRGQLLDAVAMQRVDDYLAPTVTLRRLLRHDVEDDRPRLIQASLEQRRVLDHFRNVRRADIVGPAGSGKSILRDIEQATSEDPATAGRLTVSTFHRLCETFGQRAGVLPPKPADPDRTWSEQTSGSLE